MTTKTPHVHAALIKAWADGATIEYRDHDRRDGPWLATVSPTWSRHCDYRVKPEPKPDVVMYAMIKTEPDKLHDGARITAVRANECLYKTDTCMFVFDGETGKLKDAQVLAHV